MQKRSSAACQKTSKYTTFRIDFWVPFFLSERELLHDTANVGTSIPKLWTGEIRSYAT